ncbi:MULTISPECIES: DUF3349 domain-containing protein [unclassified Gordonia (in: high G+C Gram-positive bacteria)]|uniref:DUF3349 domain-containing protein n=1 Tax=unclassified Gordonia (in: high G+C Gram-positive bacteria) TaxID=2657482 RepID=UPI001FFF7F06|nr:MULTISPECIES: DUF3349 domain-containing protein [unclassified Gordonia (in: high G+C Gram-positive bacteria)]UQE74580.1 DUF3349 domain-containing protein [Gordonia sp. PP30]
MASNVFENVINWLRSGYPEGIPPKDYPPLFALLTPILDESELTDVVLALALSRDPESPTTRDDVAAAIAAVTDSHPSQDEVNQVAARLAAAGWPLDMRVGQPG